MRDVFCKQGYICCGQFLHEHSDAIFADTTRVSYHTSNLRLDPHRQDALYFMILLVPINEFIGRKPHAGVGLAEEG